MGKCRNHGCEVVLPVAVSVAPMPCGCPVGGYGAPGAMAGFGGCHGAVGGFGGGCCPMPCPPPVQNCYAPLAGCSQGVCFENGELLIAAVLLFLGLGVFSGSGGHGGGLSQILGAVKALQ